jgi:hypothetical protein
MEDGLFFSHMPHTGRKSKEQSRQSERKGVYIRTGTDEFVEAVCLIPLLFPK